MIQQQQIFKFKPIKNLDLFNNQNIPYIQNNINIRSIGFTHKDNLIKLNIIQAAWVLIKTVNSQDSEETELVYLIGHNLDQDKQNIFVSNEIIESMNAEKNQSVFVNKYEFSDIIPINCSEDQQRFQNLLDLQIAQKIVFLNIRNKTTTLNNINILKQILQKPFICRPGDIIKINMGNPNIINLITLKDNLDYQQQKKLLKLQIKKQKCSDQKFEMFYEEDALYYIVNAIFYNKESKINQNNGQNKNAKMTILTKDNYKNYDINNQYYIIDPQKETDIFLENYQANQDISQKSIIQSKQQKQFAQFLKIIQKNDSYSQILGQLYTIFSQIKEQTEKTCQMKTILIVAPKGSGKKLLLQYLASKFKYKYYEKDVSKVSSVKHLERAKFKGVNMRPCLIHFRNLRSMISIIANKVAQEPFKNLLKTLELFLQQFKQMKYDLGDNYNTILVCSMDKYNEKDADEHQLKSLFDYFIEYQKPTDEEENKFTLNNTLQIYDRKNFYVEDKHQDLISKQIFGIPAFTLLKQIQKSQNSQDLIKNLEELKKSPDLEQLSIPNISWNDVGGLQSAKEEITKTLILPQAFPQLFNDTFRPRTGLLFFGPPGTGKTLLAKCIATECNMNFLSVKGPELLNMYIGESEKNVRDIFAKAIRNPPCVMFFDELDALAPVRGNGSDSNQVMDRIVAQFLTEMDEISKIGKIFVIGATNRPDLLDQSLLRPGRFDKMVYLGINSDDENRISILKAQTRKLQLDEDINFSEMVKDIPQNFTGADLYGLTSQSVLKAVKRKISEIDNLYEIEKEKHNGVLSFNAFVEKLLEENPGIDKTTIKMVDFKTALEGITPSVSVEELQKYEQLKIQFQG